MTLFALEKRVRTNLEARINAPVILLLHTVLKVSPLRSSGLLALTFVGSLLPAGLAVASGLFIAALPEALGDNSSPSGWTYLTASAAGLGLLFLLQQIVVPAALAAAETLGRLADRIAASRTMAALFRPATVRHLEDGSTRDLVDAINGGLGAASLRDALVGTVNITIARGGAIVGALLLVGYRWWMAAIVLASYLYIMVITSHAFQRGLTSAEGAPARMRRSVYLKDLMITVPAAKEVRVFGLADWLTGSYSKEWAAAIGEVRRGRTGAVRVSVISGLLILPVQILVFVVMAMDVLNGALSVSYFTILAIAVMGMSGMLGVTPGLVHIAVGGAKLKAIAALEDVVAKIDADSSGAAPRLRESIVFDHVSFRYPGSETWVLRDLNLVIPAGRSTAIVGVNGAGKSTLVKLLCGLHEPSEGRILIDGVDLRDLDERAWQRQCAGLFQDWLRWPLTLRENVAWGAPEKRLPDEVLQKVAEDAGLAEVVAKLPGGWDTVLSREFEGTDLSGGQWQRVGMARTLYALSAGAKVLILDEPTSALDVRGEAEFNERLLSAAPGSTAVLISHRFATVRHADNIVVLADGKVQEQGDHASLLSEDTEYAAMFALQANRFTADRSREEGL